MGTEIMTDKKGHQSSKGKPEYVVDEFDNGKTVRCADRTIWKYDAKAKLWRREYTSGHADYLRYNGGATKPKRDLPDELFERTEEHKAAIEAMKAARAKLLDVQGERAKALVKLRESRKSPAKAARIEAALDDRIEEARSEYREAMIAEFEHGRQRYRRIKDARDEQMLATMERARQRIERYRAARREGGDADLRELLGGSK